MSVFNFEFILKRTGAWAATKCLTGMCCVIAAVLLSGCTITKRVTPVPAGTAIKTVHIVENDDVLYKQSLLDELHAMIRAQGIETVSVRGQKPKDAAHHLTYRANWAWDLAMYLTYFQATLYEGDRVLGQIEYDARRGGGRLGKFGTTAAKIRPLMQEMFKNATTEAPATRR
jgi:hypothetical protein